MKPIDKEEHVKRLAYYDMGYNDREISDACGVGNGAIAQWRRTHKLKPVPGKKRVPVEDVSFHQGIGMSGDMYEYPGDTRLNQMMMYNAGRITSQTVAIIADELANQWLIRNKERMLTIMDGVLEVSIDLLQKDVSDKLRKRVAGLL